MDIGIRIPHDSFYSTRCIHGNRKKRESTECLKVNVDNHRGREKINMIRLLMFVFSYGICTTGVAS